MKELDQHEASDPKHIITPEARAADEQRIAWWEQGDHAAVIDSMEEFMKFKPEALFAPLFDDDCRTWRAKLPCERTTVQRL